MAKVQEMFFVKACEGRRVRDSETFHVLAPEGEWKPKNTYWLRRVRDEDVIEVEEPKIEAVKSIKHKSVNKE
jgi:hypothetical protein